MQSLGVRGSLHVGGTLVYQTAKYLNLTGVCAMTLKPHRRVCYDSRDKCAMTDAHAKTAATCVQ